jgi:hypothetical protein
MNTPLLRKAIARGERTAAWLVIRRLVQHLGLSGMVRVLLKLIASKSRGEPFAHLGPAQSEQESYSRRQCGDLVLLDRALRELDHTELATSLCREAVMAGAIPFLDTMIPAFSVEQLATVAESLVSQFFNAEGHAFWGSDQQFRFQVHRCWFVELLRSANADHLAPLFCEADSVFFGGNHRPVQLLRTTTLATGGSGCDFRFVARQSQQVPSKQQDEP